MIHILCLHGCRQTSEIFSHQLHKLSVALADVAVLHFIDAPYVLPLITSEDDVATRSWCRPHSDHSHASVSPTTKKTAEAATAAQSGQYSHEADKDDDDHHHQDTCTSYIGDDADYANADATLSLALQRNRYDVLLGFSEGAHMIVRTVVQGTLPGSVRGVILCGSPNMYAKHRGQERSCCVSHTPAKDQTCCGGHDTTPFSLPHVNSCSSDARHGTMTGAAHVAEEHTQCVTRDTDVMLADSDLTTTAAAAAEEELLATVPSLHVIGSTDRMVPRCDSVALARMCGSGATVLLHEGGHVWPHTRTVHEAVRQFCLGLQPSQAELTAAQETRGDELEMLVGMYGAECVQYEKHAESASATCVVRLPLFSEGEEAGDEGPGYNHTGSPGGVSHPDSHGNNTESESVDGALRGTWRLQFTLSPHYPAVWPTLEAIMLPSSSSASSLVASQVRTRIAKSTFAAAAWQRWCSGVACEGYRYLRSECARHEAMILSLYWHLRTQVTEEGSPICCLWQALIRAIWHTSQSDHTRRDALHAQPDRRVDHHHDTDTATEWWARTEQEESEDDAATREEQVAVAEREAAALLMPQSPQSMAYVELSWSAALSSAASPVTVGLIGKPSAGKSTFFNAITDPAAATAAATVGPFPFTTVEPNVGFGWAPVYCPCTTLSHGSSSATTATGTTAIAASSASHAQHDSALCREVGASSFVCDAEDGHVTYVQAVPHWYTNSSSTDSYSNNSRDKQTHGGDGCFSRWRWRRHRIRVKDVAGLVRGAYRGRGRGNRFLNDLCDADVLVHVVDGAGQTDAEGAGCVAGQGSTLTDITWVRAEVHHWIYDNLRHRWPAIVRQPQKLREMFTGYHSSPAFVDAVLRLWGSFSGAGSSSCCSGGGGGNPAHTGHASAEEGASACWQDSLPRWRPADLHRLVALYLRLRFPMVTALNKADCRPTAAQLATALRSRYPAERFISMSARVESDLLTLRRAGRVRYAAGEDTFEVLSEEAREREGRNGAESAEERAMLQRARDYFSNSSSSVEAGGTHGASKPETHTLPSSIMATSTAAVATSTTISISGDAATASSQSTIATEATLYINSAQSAAESSAPPITTGVQNVLAAAMVCVRPVLIFPVSAFPPAHTSLRRCLFYRGGTVTAESVYWALVDHGLVTGKLVRFEVMDGTVAGARVQTQRKSDSMPSSVAFVRVLTNKKQMQEMTTGRGRA